VPAAQTWGESNITGPRGFLLERGKRIIDDWSGTGLLPLLYQTLKAEPRHYTFKFVAFANEEKGLLGSAKYVKAAGQQYFARIVAFINLGHFGLGSTNVWVHRSTPMLVTRLASLRVRNFVSGF
jgi:Zn-dependent M28 family amino/carboxypeptidase